MFVAVGTVGSVGSSLQDCFDALEYCGGMDPAIRTRVVARRQVVCRIDALCAAKWEEARCIDSR